MITYDYVCDDCGHSVDIRQSIKDDPLTVCPACEKDTFRRRIHNGLIASVTKSPTTLQQQAERNTKEMGHYELQERRMAHKEGDVIAKKRAEAKANAPWWRPDTAKPDMSLTKMTPAQTKKYIETGEKSG